MTEVHVAIYDLSNGMAKGLSAQFLGPQHAIDIIPHTAIVAFGKEYFFGQGIEWCHPQEFRMTRGIHPIDIQSLGHTSCSQSEFEAWCRMQGQNGRFSATSYDLLSRNCNNFTEEAAREGLRLGRGIPSWILEVPQRFLSSPLGTMVRPMLEQMQLTNSAPTNVSHQMNDAQSYTPSATPAVAAAAAANPWAHIPETPPAPKESNDTSSAGTPFLDKQTALLSTDTGVVKICLDRLNTALDQREILSKLGDAKYAWTHAELQSVHQMLRLFMNETKQISFALMLLRLVVLREPSTANIDKEESQSTEFVADLLLQNKLQSMSNRSMAWCVLSNAFGSKQLPSWTSSEDNNQSEKFLQLIDRAVIDCDPSVADASTPTQKALRQSASAFLYNTSRQLTAETNNGGADGNSELNEAIMSLLIGCLENLGEENDSTSINRRYMCIGQILKSREFGQTAVGLTKDLGMVDVDMIQSASYDHIGDKVAKEVASLL